MFYYMYIACTTTLERESIKCGVAMNYYTLKKAWEINYKVRPNLDMFYI